MSIIKRKTHLLDVYRSRMSTGEIVKYKEQITKQKNNPVCRDLSTAEVAAKGAQAMQADKFQLVKEQLNV